MKTLIRNVKLFDGTALAPRPMDVLFDESGILAVKEAGAAPAAADAVVDGTGKTLTPGLIDGHVHLGSLSMSSPTDPKGHTAAGALIAAQVQDLRRWGITAVRNCGTGVNADLVVRDMIRDGLIDGARIVGCGRCICITGGHAWPMGIETDTVDETRKAARLQLREGADFVKLMATGGMGTKGSVPNAPQLTEAQMRAAAEEAGKRTGVILLTGGGIVKTAENYAALHQNGRIYQLVRDLSLLPTEGRPLSQGADLAAMWAEREPLYRRFPFLSLSLLSRPLAA